MYEHTIKNNIKIAVTDFTFGKVRQQDGEKEEISSGAEIFKGPN